MMKEEFENLIGKTIDHSDYMKVEYVYNWSPLIDNVNGKKQIAELYKMFGMAIIRQMIPIATKAEKLNQDICNLKQIIEEKQELLGDLALGYDVDIGCDISGLIEE